jgi:hypothetical protein
LRLGAIEASMKVIGFLYAEKGVETGNLGQRDERARASMRDSLFKG